MYIVCSEEKLVPICIGYNKQHHTYRFENSATGCIGDHKEHTTILVISLISIDSYGKYRIIWNMQETYKNVGLKWV